MFTIGQTYKRIELHKRYGGQQQGGISTPAERNFIMLFSGKTGHSYGYDFDGWSHGLFLYTGEGQEGDMQFTKGNLAIRDHIKNGRDIHLFQLVGHGNAEYLGQMTCVGYQKQRGLDRQKRDREVIIFELKPIDSSFIVNSKDPEIKEMVELSIDELRKRAIAVVSEGKKTAARKATSRYRSDTIKVYVLKRANGICEACGNKAPFKTNGNNPYLETHHIDGGPDDPNYVIGVCPNCHRRAEYSIDKVEFNRSLADIVLAKEKLLGS